MSPCALSCSACLALLAQHCCIHPLPINACWHGQLSCTYLTYHELKSGVIIIISISIIISVFLIIIIIIFIIILVIIITIIIVVIIIVSCPILGCVWLQVRDCGSLLTVGGFNIPAVDVDDITIHYKDFQGVVNHLRSACNSALPPSSIYILHLKGSFK